MCCTVQTSNAICLSPHSPYKLFEVLTKMATNGNGGDLMGNDSCKLCDLSGSFEVSVVNDDPIEKIVKAVGVKYLPWETEGEPEDAENFNMTSFTEKLDKHWQEWQENNIINLKSLSSEESEKHDRANKAEEVVSDTVR